MEKSDQPANQSASQPSSQAPAQPANRWQPITDLYQQEIAGNAPPAVVQPPKPAPVPVSQRDLPKNSVVPMSLNIITGLYFVRAVVFLACPANSSPTPVPTSRSGSFRSPAS
ncbi:MAG: hypothetical protein ACLQHF_04155 [Terracidiphilus sp.]